MSANDLNETMHTLCRAIGKDLVKFNVNVIVGFGLATVSPFFIMFSISIFLSAIYS